MDKKKESNFIMNQRWQWQTGKPYKPLPTEVRALEREDRIIELLESILAKLDELHDSIR